MRRDMVHHLPLLLASLASIGLATGCSRRSDDKWSRARPATHRVSGRVIQEGQPVQGAKVQFSLRSLPGERGTIAFGVTDAGGRFTLQTFRDGDGAVAGTHAVTIEKVSVVQKPPPPNSDILPPAEEISELPARYRSPGTSGFEAVVSAAGPNAFEFNLSKD